MPEDGALNRHTPRSTDLATPFDRDRLDLFLACARFLADLVPFLLLDPPEIASRRNLVPFYDAYFSNYIEGIEFTVDEADQIVFDEVVPADRPRDAHDIIGTYHLVADPIEMKRTPRTSDEFIELLRARHSAVMEDRPDASPGHFKTRANRSGATTFVAPSLVEATLRAGFEAGAGLLDPFARAMFLTLLVTEVHPFTDGNGRIARIMMNAELVASGQVRIIVPTVARTDYFGSLKLATNSARFEALANVLRFLQRYTAQVDFSSRPNAYRDLARTNAFVEPSIARENNIRLVLPASLDSPTRAQRPG